MKNAVVIGAGPAGLMAADVLSQAGIPVTVFEGKPSAGRKFLMAGKSGLNLTKDEPLPAFLSHYAEAEPQLVPMLTEFGPKQVQEWAQGLDQEIFTGTTGRVFPKTMKASPLMRAWMARLAAQGVELRAHARWLGWDEDSLAIRLGDTVENVHADVVVLALGGGSWARLGSDGAWVGFLEEQGVRIAPFRPANFGVHVSWSDHMQRHIGMAIKNVRLSAGGDSSRGEAVISADGLEGGGIYEISRALRNEPKLTLDLLPDLEPDEIAKRLAQAPKKASMSNRLRKSLRLDPVKIALAQECARPLPHDPLELARALKSLHITTTGPRPLDQAISTAGGVPFSELDPGLMLKAKPGVFCAGEMLDWEAPTGGYLLTACLATGRWAGHGAIRYLQGD